MATVGNKKAAPITAVWLRTDNPDPRYPNLKQLAVLVEIDGEWRKIIAAHVPPFEAEVGHIYECATLVDGGSP